MFYGHAVVLGARRDPRGGPAGRRRDRGRVRAAAVDRQRARRDRGRQLPGPPAHGRRAATSEPGWSRPHGRSAASSSSAARSTSTWRRNAALALVDENGQIFIQSSTQHPSETQDIVVARARHPGAQHHRAVPADGRRLRRQGVPAARSGRDRRARRDHHRSPGAAAAQPDPGHHDDRQAAPVPRHLGGRLRRGQQDLRAARHPDQQRRLEPRPVRAGAGPRALPHRQLVLDPQHRGARPDRQDQPGVQHRVPRLRRSAGHDRDRGHPRPLRPAARRRARGAAPAQLLQPRPGNPVRAAGPARRAARRRSGRSWPSAATSSSARPRSPRSTRRTRTPSAGWR